MEGNTVDNDLVNKLSDLNEIGATNKVNEVSEKNILDTIERRPECKDKIFTDGLKVSPEKFCRSR